MKALTCQGSGFPVAQWSRICLPAQETWVQVLIWEAPTCHRTTDSVPHNYWACVLAPVSCNYCAMRLRYWSLSTLEPALCNKRDHHNEKPTQHSWRAAPSRRNWGKPTYSNEDPSTAKNKINRCRESPTHLKHLLIVLINIQVVGFFRFLALIYLRFLVLWRRKWQPIPVFLPGNSHGQRTLADCSPQNLKELDMT